MIESPLIRDIVDTSRREERVKAITRFLEARFKAVTPAISAGLELIKDQDGLERLTGHAALCASLQEFEQRLREELPAPPPPSTRGSKQRRSHKKPD